MKKLTALMLALVLLALVLLASLFACAGPKEPEVSETPPEPRAEESELKGTLKVLSERFCWNSSVSMVNYNNFSPPRDNIANVMFYFQELHPDVRIEIEYLPTDQEEREAFIKQRRVAMMAGKDVPDIYLMPTSSLAAMSYEPMEPLFKDVAQTMRNNWFADISGLYNGDTELHTEELNKAVMDAGTIGGARYVLPLGYEMPVYITRKDLLDDAGIDRERLNAGVDSMIDTFIELREQGDPRWAASSYFGYGLDLSLLPKACDYEKEEVLIDSKQVENLLLDLAEDSRITAEEWQKRKDAGETIPGRTFHAESYFLSSPKDTSTAFAVDEDYPGSCSPMSEIIDAVGCGKSMGHEMEVIPVRATDGTLNAEITYWGAIGAGCENKKLAYEFLRLFLTPEVQHEGQLKSKTNIYEMNFKLVKDALTGPFPGWPVRYKGFAKNRWSRELDGIRAINSGNSQKKEALLGVTVDDSDLPFLDVPIDNARFISSVDEEFYQYTENFADYTQADAAKAANEFIRNVSYHLAEG
nr:extracellular solute-binding protein [uncultured Acetatifactor sp.]